MSMRRSKFARVTWALSSLATSTSLVAALAGPAAASGQATFQALGSLDPGGAGPVIAYGISADGRAVVGQSNSPQGFQAFRWTPGGGLQGLGAFVNPGAQGSLARACSADGSVIVGGSQLPDSLNEDGSPFRWTAATGLVWLGSLGGSSGGVARGVSSDGSVVVGYGSNANFDPEAFRWTAASGLVPLGDLPGGVFNSQASAVSADGTRVIGLASTAGSAYNTSFRWSVANGLQQMMPAGFRTIGMSRDGAFAAGTDLGRAARVDIDAGTELILPHVTIPGLGTDTDTAWAANGDGSVVVGMQNLSLLNGFFGRAFVWDAAHGTRILRNVLIDDFGLGAQLAGWELNSATCVSDDGRTFAGYGFAPSGEQWAWRATLPDCETTAERFCFGDGSGGACPCANGGLAGRGCQNSAATGGASLDAAGCASLVDDHVVLGASAELPNALTIFLQGTQEIAPITFGDGLRCAGGTLRRLYSANAVAGSVSAPPAGGSSVSARSAELGDPIPNGATRVYLTYYRDPDAAFCPPPAGDTWNASNAVRIVWLP
jgi:probable HAF family extracellular repeat protein